MGWIAASIRGRIYSNDQPIAMRTEPDAEQREMLPNGVKIARCACREPRAANIMSPSACRCPGNRKSGGVFERSPAAMEAG